jgi:hypothetical protein
MRLLDELFVFCVKGQVLFIITLSHKKELRVARQGAAQPEFRCCMQEGQHLSFAFLLSSGLEGLCS